MWTSPCLQSSILTLSLNVDQENITGSLHSSDCCLFTLVREETDRCTFMQPTVCESHSRGTVLKWCLQSQRKFCLFYKANVTLKMWWVCLDRCWGIEMLICINVLYWHTRKWTVLFVLHKFIHQLGRIFNCCCIKVLVRDHIMKDNANCLCHSHSSTDNWWQWFKQCHRDMSLWRQRQSHLRSYLPFAHKWNT